VTVEDHLRAAAKEIDKIMYPVSPLALPPIGAPAPARSRTARTRRTWSPRPAWPSWLLPMVAAVAVVAVALSLVAVRDLPGARHASPSAPSSVRLPLPPVSTKPVAIPRYAVFVAAQGMGQPRAIVVTDTRTGRAIFTLKPRSGATFSGVAGAGDDRTFVVDEMPFAGKPGAHVWSLLRITPGAAHPVKVTALPHLAQPGSTQNLGLAVSPNGATLAVLSQPGAGTKLGPVTLQTFSLVTGLASHTWTTSKPGEGGILDFDNEATLSWLSDNRTLAFQTGYLRFKPQTIFLLDTASTGHALLANSRPIFTMPGDEFTCWTALLTPDGHTAFCTGASPNEKAPGETAVTAYSTATGKPQRVLYRARMDGELFWAGSATQAIIMMLGHPSAKDPKELVDVLGVVTPNKFTAFPIATGHDGYSYGLIAF
jgi:hypothetical protein